MFGTLTEKDLKEGKELAEIFSRLPEVEKMQVKIYTQALSDRNEVHRKQNDFTEKEAG